MCSFDILLPIGGAVSLVFGVLFLCFRGVVLNFRGLDFNFTKVTILLHIPQYLFPFFQLLNSEAYRLHIVLRSPSDRIPSAVRSDSVRRPIGFRSPSDQISSAVRSDSVRRPIGFRSPSDQISSAVRSDSVRRPMEKPKKKLALRCLLQRKHQLSIFLLLCKKLYFLFSR